MLEAVGMDELILGKTDGKRDAGRTRSNGHRNSGGGKLEEAQSSGEECFTMGDVI